QNSGSTVHPLEAKRNIYQHARQGIERDQDSLFAQLGAHLGPHDFDIADREISEGVATLEARQDRVVHPFDAPQLLHVADQAVALPIAEVADASRQLGVAFAGRRPERQRVARGEKLGQSRWRGSIQVLLRRVARAKHGMERLDDGLLAGIERLAPLAALLEPNHQLVRVGIGEVGDALNDAVSQALPGQALADLVDRWRLGESHVHERAAFKVDPVAQATLARPGDAADHEQGQGEGDEILRLAHPVQVDLAEQLHAHSSPYKLDTGGVLLVPAQPVVPGGPGTLLSPRPAKYLAPPGEASAPGANGK